MYSEEVMSGRDHLGFGEFVSKVEGLRISFRVLAGLLLLCTLICLYLSDGVFIYALDDPYIHLALSENLLKGHYGVNLQEMSAASSSIVWPYILAVFGANEFSPLLINMVLIFGCTVLIHRLLTLSAFFASMRPQRIDVATLALIVGFNGIGLVFVGMEHVLHVLTSLAIVYGLSLTAKRETVGVWFWMAIALNPLVRYEGLALSGLALLYLFFNGRYLSSVFTGLFIVAVMGGFSGFLYLNGLGVVPSSVAVKSLGDISHGEATSYIDIFVRNLLTFGGILTLLLVAKNIHALFRQFRSNKSGAMLHIHGIVIIAALTHFFAGRFGWFGRYEVYIVLPLLISFLHLHANDLFTKQSNGKKGRSILKGSLITLIVLQFFLYSLIVPLSSNSIYRQQYQMHRFATQFWNKPIAVNDLGWVSYQNDNYVMDIWGLGSYRSIELQRAEPQAWLDLLLKENTDVSVAMIYEKQFEEAIPAHWEEIAYLEYTRFGIGPPYKRVTFFLTVPDVEERALALESLKAFSHGLPGGVALALVI